MRLVLALIAGAICLTPAQAMPSDLPWDVYGCSDDKQVALKFLSDGMTISVFEAGEAPQDVSPVDGDKQGGFKPGTYKGEGGMTLTLDKDGQVGISGKTATKDGYKRCNKIERAEGLWQAYGCKDDRSFSLYFEMNAFIAVRLDGEEVATVSHKPDEGLQTGTYVNPEGNLTLTLGGPGKTGLSGDLVEKPYEGCRNMLKP